MAVRRLPVRTDTLFRLPHARSDVYSLNVPLPGAVERLAADLRPRLTPFDRVRERHTLLGKRFQEENLHRLRERLRPALAGTPTFEVGVDGIDFFENPPSGPGPVVYLTVESPGLMQLHERLYETFSGVEGLEGAGFVPHVTLARGGSIETAEALREMEIEPVVWTASELHLWDPRYRESVAQIGLPT